MRAGNGTPYHTRPTDVSPGLGSPRGRRAHESTSPRSDRAGKKEGKSRGASVGTHMATRFSCLSATPLHNFWAEYGFDRTPR